MEDEFVLTDEEFELTDEDLDFRYGDTLHFADEENTRNLLDAFYRHSDVEDFLRDEDIHIPIFPTVVDNPSETIVYNYDIDGVVIELKGISAVKASIHYLMLGKVIGVNLQTHWHSLKKHFPLKEYGPAGLSALKHTYGHTLAFVDGGYLLNICCVSAQKVQPHPLFASEMASRANTAQVINTVLDVFSANLKKLPPQELQRPTLFKNNISDLSRMNVLADDQQFILQLLEQAIMEVEKKDPNYTIVTFLQKFGQKQGTPLQLASLVNRHQVDTISCHAACTLSARDPRIDVMWSRYGLQEVVGHRGNIYTSSSIPEAANFQSNLDSHTMTVDKDVTDIFVGAQRYSEITFLQLYSNTPHVHMTNTKHPVSRVIATCGVHIKRHYKLLMQRALTYIKAMEDSARKSQCRTHARMEAVFRMKEPFPVLLEAKDFFNLYAIHKLLLEKPMLIPFKDNQHGLGLRHVLNPVETHMVAQLQTLLQTCHGQGGYSNSWTAFQLELALEEVFFGRLFCPQSKPFSISLGTDSSSPNSLTKRRGFLGLSPIGSASVGESPPPMKTWIKDPIQISRIERIFPFTETLHSEPTVIGEALLRVIISDLYDLNHGISIERFKTGDIPLLSKLVGHRTKEQLCKDLCERKGFQYPMTFERAREMTERAGHDVLACMNLGLNGVKFFPAFTFWDEQRHPKVRWNKKEFIEIYNAKDAPSEAAEAAALVGDVCAQIEKRNLCYSSNLQRYKENGMPWMEPALKRLPKNMTQDLKLNTLTLVSCAGIIQNGDYVSFGPLRALIRDTTMPQTQLQRLTIMSPLILVHNPCLNRLHQNIPHKVPPRQPPNPKKATATDPPKRDASPDLDDDDEEEYEDAQVVERVKTKTVPANSRSQWSRQEEDMLRVNPQMSHAEAYKAYVKECERQGRPARTLRAFRSKRQRLN